MAMTTLVGAEINEPVNAVRPAGRRRSRAYGQPEEEDVDDLTLADSEG
jgi:hypothetical protein